MIDIDWLRNKNNGAHYFGLGFIQIKMGDYLRFHFYHKDVPAFVEEPHDHRYHFTSHVQKGSLANYIYILDGETGDQVSVEYESCKEGPGEVPPKESGTSMYFGSFRVNAGSGYTMHADTFHTVTPFLQYGPVITSIQRTRPHKTFARVLRKPDASPVCPFSRPMEPSRLWEIVRDSLQ